MDRASNSSSRDVTSIPRPNRKSFAIAQKCLEKVSKFDCVQIFLKFFGIFFRELVITKSDFMPKNIF